jgi:hypothetical protein
MGPIIRPDSRPGIRWTVDATHPHLAAYDVNHPQRLMTTSRWPMFTDVID